MLKSISHAIDILKTTNKVYIDYDDGKITAYKMMLQGREITRIDISKFQEREVIKNDRKKR